MADPDIFAWQSINGVEVRWQGRDIKQASSKEIQIITDLVEIEKDHEGKDHNLSAMVIESEYVDKDIVRYRTSVRTEVRLEDMYEE